MKPRRRLRYRLVRWIVLRLLRKGEIYNVEELVEFRKRVFLQERKIEMVNEARARKLQKSREI